MSSATAAPPTPPRRAERSRPSKGDRREQSLLDAAERLIGAGRFEAASIAELAAEAGLSRASFYFYFASKQALLSAVIAHAVADLEARLGEQLAGIEDHSPAELVAGTVRAAVDLWWDHRVVLVASVELGATLPEVYDRNRDSIRGAARTTLALLRRAGHPVPPGDADLLVDALVLMSERNLYDLARRSHRRRDYDRLGDVLTTIWLRALALAD